MCLGGIGSKDLIVFNDALLGRPAWRVRKPSSLFGRVMKEKYLRTTIFLMRLLEFLVAIHGKAYNLLRHLSKKVVFGE